MINAKIDSCVVLIDSVLFFEAKSFHERRTKFSSKELGAQNKLWIRPVHYLYLYISIYLYIYIYTYIYIYIYIYTQTYTTLQSGFIYPLRETFVQRMTNSLACLNFSMKRVICLFFSSCRLPLYANICISSSSSFMIHRQI